MLRLIRRAPEQFGYRCSRWTPAMIAASCDWRQVTSAAGLWQVLKRLGISDKRGRDYVHSPESDDEAKLSLIELARLRAYFAPEGQVFLYLDELTYHRQPTLAGGYEACGATQPLAQRAYRSNTTYRILGTRNALTGQVSYRQRSHTDRTCLAGFWGDLGQTYPNAEQIYVVVDNWPVHFHPDVLAPVQPQHFPFPPKLPANWPTEPSRPATVAALPIQLLCLPSYASWLNPIAKLWRWLKQDVLHLYRLSHDWQKRKGQVAGFLDGFADGSTQLLRYLGLLPI